MPTGLEERKGEHIRLSLEKNVSSTISPGLDDVKFIHMSLPEINLDEVTTSIKFLDHTLSAPLLIESMTGGTAQAERINRNLAEAAEEIGVAIGVGSQRAALKNPRLEKTFRVVRERAPSVPILANIGCSQLLDDDADTAVHKAIEMMQANALTIHLNPLQEAIQPEGETRFKGILDKIADLTSKIQVPLIVKETGAGISKEIAVKLSKAGVKYVDVAGVGGTTWAGVEHYRAEKRKDTRRANLGKLFWNWGIPTTVSLIETLATTDMKVIASGGVRSGIDIAKSLALGADLAGMALPFLSPATKNADLVKRKLNEVIEELRVTMFLTSSPTPPSLKKAPLVILGDTYTWLTQRGIYVRDYLEKRIRLS